MVKPMPQSLAKVLIHMVFSTKERSPFLRDTVLRSELHRYRGGILNQLHCQSLVVGGVEDHVHALACLSRTCTLAEMIKELKRGSSLWIKEKEPTLVNLPGRTDTAHFRSGIRRSQRCAATLVSKRSITGDGRFKTNSGNFSSATK
jgi:REP element-mobilizing transposase RayT